MEWLYQIGRPAIHSVGTADSSGRPAGFGTGDLYESQSDPVRSGLVIYYITRTFLNGLRSVEAVVMAIVFVIAVGIGPFAGVMALGLHTIVSLAKLYSEQVESISAGPLEAIQATGANRLQTIIYAVIPQIVPPIFPIPCIAGTSTCACPRSSVSWAAAVLAFCSAKYQPSELPRRQRADDRDCHRGSDDGLYLLRTA